MIATNNNGVRKVIPVEQGLRHLLDKYIICTNKNVRKVIPVEQGLRLVKIVFTSKWITVLERLFQ